MQRWSQARSKEHSSMSGERQEAEVRAGTVVGQPWAQELSPSCSRCSSKLGAALGCCGVPHGDALGIQHRDAPSPCAPTLPASKLSPGPLQLLLHESSSPPRQHPPLPQAPAAPLHLKWAKQGQRCVPGTGWLLEPPAAAGPGHCPVTDGCCAGRSCPGGSTSHVCWAPRGTLVGQGGPGWAGKPSPLGLNVISLASLN